MSDDATFTVNRIMAWEPCPEYPRERVEALFANRKSLTLREVLTLDIPAADRIWVATRPGALPYALRVTWLERIVTRAVTAHALKCGVPEVETWARRWLSGEDRSADSAAAADAAAWAAADAAAVAWATWAASADSACATRAAAWAAAEAAAEALRASEAWAAEAASEALAAERDAQLADLLAVLGGEE